METKEKIKEKKSNAISKKKKLVIVESPTKAKTINRYLGADYIVKSSMGHLIDLPKSRLGIDLDNGFEPEYITIRGRQRGREYSLAYRKQNKIGKFKYSYKENSFS